MTFVDEEINLYDITYTSSGTSSSSSCMRILLGVASRYDAESSPLSGSTLFFSTLLYNRSFAKVSE